MLLKPKDVGSSASTTPTPSVSVSTTEISTISTNITGMKIIECCLEVKCIISVYLLFHVCIEFSHKLSFRSVDTQMLWRDLL